jgi:hypothetical protein
MQIMQERLSAAIASDRTLIEAAASQVHESPNKDGSRFLQHSTRKRVFHLPAAHPMIQPRPQRSIVEQWRNTQWQKGHLHRQHS